MVHERMRPKASAPPTPEQNAYHRWLRNRDVLCECGCGRSAQCTHHILAQHPAKYSRRDHWFVVRLSHHCHNGGTDSVHMLGSEEKFCEVHGVDLVGIAATRWAEWREQ